MTATPTSNQQWSCLRPVCQRSKGAGRHSVGQGLTCNCDGCAYLRTVAYSLLAGQQGRASTQGRALTMRAPPPPPPLLPTHAHDGEIGQASEAGECRSRLNPHKCTRCRATSDAHLSRLAPVSSTCTPHTLAARASRSQ